MAKLLKGAAEGRTAGCGENRAAERSPAASGLSDARAQPGRRGGTAAAIREGCEMHRHDAALIAQAGKPVNPTNGHPINDPGSGASMIGQAAHARERGENFGGRA